MRGDTEASPPPSRSMWIGAAALFVGFSVVAVDAIGSAEEDPLAANAVTVRPMPATAGNDGPPSGATSPEQRSPALRPELAKAAEELLSKRFFVRERNREMALRNVMSPRTVTVVNVWATWCEPCKAEFEDFRRLWKGWGSDVRFVPIELSSLMDERDSSRQVEQEKLHRRMPPTENHLVDMSGSLVQNTLRNGLDAAESVAVPITLVFDCKRRLVWHTFKQLEDEEGFAAVIDGLRPALSTSACHEPSPAGPELPVMLPAVAEPRCGDNTCTPWTQEDCHSCPEDCGCSSGKVCVERDAASLQPGSTPYVCDSPSPLYQSP